jgi:hypothetical protein
MRRYGKKIPGIRRLLPLLLVLALAAAGCSSGDDDDFRSYRVSMTNLTHNQPMSPAAVALHGAGARGWETGAGASVGLEDLAEGGSPAAFLAEAETDPDVFTTAAGGGVFMPGTTTEVEIGTFRDGTLYVTAASMLVNTNDAFTGITRRMVSGLEVGESWTAMVPAYDAGTEANSERAATIPGPAAGGEGFNADRDDQDFVTIHPGVVTADDGLGTSILRETHRWDNPVARIMVTRIE